MITHALALLGLVAFFMPVAASLVLGVPWAVGLALPETTIKRTVAGSFAISLAACLAIDLLLLADPGLSHTINLANWLVVPDYAIHARIVLDLPGAVFMTLTALLVGLVGAFSEPYLHQDPGLRRFYVLMPLFASGMMAVAAADTLDLLYAGWEVVGLTSALLIAYFDYREAPARHGLRAFAVYRVCDVALLSATVLLHHYAGDATPSASAHLDEGPRLLIALLLIFASMGKAAAFPFTGWLPRAMEGPTPSSAIFYGALSIHAGPFLLVRAWPILADLPLARGVLVAIGVVTAVHASLVGRVQTDVKSQLGYASAAQVGLMMIELGLGLPTLVLAHLTGHAILRTWQLLRAPSLIHDHHQIVGMVGGSRPERGAVWRRVLPPPLARLGYRVALERWYVGDFSSSWLLGTLRGLLTALDRLDRRWTGLLAGRSAEVE